MKEIIFSVFLFLSLPQVYSKGVKESDFKIKNISGDYFLQKVDTEIKLFKLPGVPVNAKVLNVINNPKASHLYFVTYLSETAGTSTVAEIYNAVVWDEKKERFVKNVLYKTVVINSKGKKEIPALWDFQKSKVVVSEEGKVLAEVPY